MIKWTDSLFIKIPICPEDIIERIKLVNQISKETNKLIIDYNTEYLLPRCGYSPSRNEVFFKEEMILDMMLFLDVKKAYAYRQITSEAEVDPNTNKLIAGKILSKPKIKKKSTLGVKSDTIQMTKDILDKLINLALSSESNKYNKMIAIIGEYNQTFFQKIKNFEFENIGAPVRWQRKIYVNNAMKLYNTLVEPVFQHLSPGYMIYCKFHNMQLIKDTKVDLPFDKLNAIAIPQKYSPEVIKKQLQKYQIEFDLDKQWGNILNKTCYRIIDSIKAETHKNETK